jgi:hypothetical protein
MTERDDHDSASVHLSAQQAENLARALEAALNSTDRQDAKIDYARASRILAAELERLENEKPILGTAMTRDPSAKVREVIETAMRDLRAVGLDHDGAASLLVVQGAIRIEGAEAQKEALDFVTDTFTSPIDDTEADS